MTVASIDHIVLDDKGVARIAGSRIRVSQIAAEHLKWAWSAEAIHRQHDHLSLSKIYAALAYFYDHRSEIERELEEEDRFDEQMRQTHSSPLNRPEVKKKLDEIRALLDEEK
jgi:uncharacterized protein (DUF433 family)